MAFVKAVHKISNGLDYLCGLAAIICLAAMVVLTGMQIVCRLAENALAWSEEVTRYLMVWATFLGASCVYKRMGHINVTLLQTMVSKSLRTVMQAACHILCATFALLAVVHGLDYMDMQSTQLSAALRIPMSWVYLAIPVGFSIMTVHVLDLLLKMLPCNCNEET